MLVVPDTSVLVSATVSTHTPPARILDAWRSSELNFALCPQILDEVSRTLHKPYFQRRLQWGDETIGWFRNQLQQNAIMVPATTPVMTSPDPDDNMLFACAIEAGASHIISGDKRHVLIMDEYEGITTISPGDFVKRFLQSP